MNPRLDSLINRWIDGELSPPEAEAVQCLLAEDPEARRICYELLMVDRLLDEKFDGSSRNTDTFSPLSGYSQNSRPRRFRFASITAIAAIVSLSLIGWFLIHTKPGKDNKRPLITGSTDSRITIAQRQDAENWAIGELLRLERGTADIRLTEHAGAHFQGPSAIELLDQNGSIRILEGMASFKIGSTSASTASEVHVPGGLLRSIDSRYISEVLPDGNTNIRVESGFIEIRPRGKTPVSYLKEGDSVRLAPDGSNRSIRLPHYHFRSSLPQKLTLFRDDFNAPDNSPLDARTPSVGQAWEVLSEINPTTIRNERLDTSSGARRIVANFLNHDPQGPSAVYILSFDIHPPEWIGDKSQRLGGIEHITIQDENENDIISIVAKAANSHRWQLADERTKATSAITPVCALWTHSLTLCYGLDGLVTLHDGATAQSPIIAELRITDPPPAARLLIGNLDGGDVAISRIEAVLLPSPAVEDL